MSRPTPRESRLLAALERADSPRKLWRAREKIIGRLRNHPHETLRIALAEHYRTRGVSSQAGVWGVTSPGWATDREIRDARRFVLGQFSTDDYVRFNLRLTSTDAVPDEFVDLVDPAFRAPYETPPQLLGVGCGMLVAQGASVLVAAACVLSLIGELTVRGSLTSAPALAGVTLGAAIIFLALFMIDRRARKRRAGNVGSSVPEIPTSDPLFGTTLAWRLWDSGQHRESQILLRSMIRFGTDEAAARRALVAMCREVRRPDQAGRWGCMVPGLTTPAERGAYARHLRGEQRRQGLGELSMASPGRLPADALDVLRRAKITPPTPTSGSVGVDEGDFGMSRREKATLITVVWLSAVAAAIIVALAAAQLPIAIPVARGLLVLAGLAAGGVFCWIAVRAVRARNFSSMRSNLIAGLLLIGLTATATAAWTLGI